MSLTSFLENRDVVERFKKEFERPTVPRAQHTLLASPLTNRYAVVGTAFDYLLRFYIKKINLTAVTQPWIAERSADILKKKYSAWFKKPEDAIGLVFGMASSEADIIIIVAKQNYSTYLKNGKITDDLIKSTLCLAQLDVVYRSKFEHLLETELGKTWKRDLKDLKNLISIVDGNIFKASEICLLNPTFGDASQLIGGADADVIIDDRLIDIKTTIRPHFKREYLHQLVGYYALTQIGGLDGAPLNHKITKLEIYFSRFGYLRSINVDEIIKQKTFPKFLAWFKRRVMQEQKGIIDFQRV